MLLLIVIRLSIDVRLDGHLLTMITVTCPGTELCHISQLMSTSVMSTCVDIDGVCRGLKEPIKSSIINNIYKCKALTR